MKARPFLLHALSPPHAGTGQAADVIDLPTARLPALPVRTFRRTFVWTTSPRRPTWSPRARCYRWLIAGAFHRTGAIEVWGRGTNRVIEACRAYGIAEPTFSEDSGAVTVTFEGEVVAGARSRDQAGTKLGLSRDQVQLLEIAEERRTLPELMAPSGRTNRTKFRDQILAPLLDAGLVEMTVPDKPRSPKQQYRTTAAGRVALANAKKA